MQNPTENLLSGALAVVMEYQRTGCQKAAQKVLITLKALIHSDEIPEELISQAEELVEEIEQKENVKAVNGRLRQMADSPKQRIQISIAKSVEELCILGSFKMRDYPVYADMTLE